ncbi:MAG: SDR family oxidoreductase [Planctomycetes bacterium]|nr:SDR family oxidoreductase [Planctomycetota bacterium]
MVKLEMADYLSKLFGLGNKVAVVIGAAGLLCSEMASSLAKSGVKVAVVDRDEEGAKRVADVIVSEGGIATNFGIDVTRKNDHEELLAAVVQLYGKVDILINGAGINAPTPILDIPEDEWQSILDTNLKGTLLGCQVFGKHMIGNKAGSIINMSSASSGPPLSRAFTYSVSKAGVKNLTQNLAREWAPYNVRVNALRPGFFPTEWSRRKFITAEREQSIFGHTPMGRYGEPVELVGAVLWLASDAASFVTGAEIAVDGGFTAMTI